MSNWTECPAVMALAGPLDLTQIELEVPESPPWLHEMADALHDWAHDVWAMRGFTVACRLWLPRDENRRVPMPLRYAAAQPTSPAAILGVLGGVK